MRERGAAASAAAGAAAGADSSAGAAAGADSSIAQRSFPQDPCERSGTCYRLWRTGAHSSRGHGSGRADSSAVAAAGAVAAAVAVAVAAPRESLLSPPPQSRIGRTGQCRCPYRPS